jgi:hypothetical protein
MTDDYENKASGNAQMLIRTAKLMKDDDARDQAALLAGSLSVGRSGCVIPGLLFSELMRLGSFESILHLANADAIDTGSEQQGLLIKKRNATITIHMLMAEGCVVLDHLQSTFYVRSFKKAMAQIAKYRSTQGDMPAEDPIGITASLRAAPLFFLSACALFPSLDAAQMKEILDSLATRQKLECIRGWVERGIPDAKVAELLESELTEIKRSNKPGDAPQRVSANRLSHRIQNMPKPSIPAPRTPIAYTLKPMPLKQ